MKENRRKQALSQADLAEKVSTSAHYISQIELQNKFPAPEMLERIAAALEIDSPQLFSMSSFSEEAIKRFQEAVKTDMGTALETALSDAIAKNVSELKMP